MPEISAEDLANAKVDSDQLRKTLQFTLWQLEGLRHWEKDAIFDVCKTMAQCMELKPKDLFGLLFVAITGSANSVSVFDAMVILGPDMSRARLRHALNVMGGPSKKEAKRWDKEYRTL